MLKAVLIVVAVVIAAIAILAIVIANRPSEFTVTRSTTIAAPPDVVFAQVNDFHQWEAWNPWGKLDPNMTQMYDCLLYTSPNVACDNVLMPIWGASIMPTGIKRFLDQGRECAKLFDALFLCPV